MAENYTPYGSEGVGKQYVEWGLGQAQNQLQGMKQPSYPTYPYQSLQGPVQQSYYNLSSAPQYQQVSGLMGGDYNRLESALAAPSWTAYQRNTADINNAMGANGLYGSMGQGMHSDALAGAGQTLQSGLAQAAATRYGLQQSDIDRQTEQAKTAFQAGLLGSEQANSYNQSKQAYDLAQAQGQVDWQNQMALQPYYQQMEQAQRDQAYQQMMLENYLAMSSGATPMASQAQSEAANAYQAEQNRQLQSSIASQQANTANTSGWLGAAGSVLGGLLGGAGQAGGFGNLFNW